MSRTVQNQASSSDRVCQQESSGPAFANDDSGFSEPLHFNNTNELEDARLIARCSLTQQDVGSHRAHSGREPDCFPHESPVPQSSSTPNRVEIFIDEQWNISQPDAENEPFDLFLDGSVTDYYWNDSKDENNNLEIGKISALQSLQDVNNIKFETDFDEKKTVDSIIQKTYEKDVGNEKSELKTELSDPGRNEKAPFSSPPEIVMNSNILLGIKEEPRPTVLLDTSPRILNAHTGTVRYDLKPLVQIKTDLYDDISDDDNPKAEGNALKSETNNDLNETLANDTETHTNAIQKVAELPLVISKSNSSDINTGISKASEENDNDDNDSVVPRRKRTGRKMRTPRRSPSKADPKFKGATVWFQTEYKGGRSRLNISAIYSNVSVLFSDRSRHGLFVNHGGSPDSSCYSETEGNGTPPHGREAFVSAKSCASCRTRRTPLWRDAEDGTPLCNACGIRYKKYRLRCSKCWLIPKKDIKTYPNCPACGASLRYVFSRRAW